MYFEHFLKIKNTGKDSVLGQHYIMTVSAVSFFGFGCLFLFMLQRMTVTI